MFETECRFLSSFVVTIIALSDKEVSQNELCWLCSALFSTEFIKEKRKEGRTKERGNRGKRPRIITT